ncbi:MAG: C39 family peptidase [Candidatus Kerfeldbacteria bacterium]
MKSRLALLNTVLIIFIVIGLGILFRGRIIGLWDDWMVNDSTPEPVAFTNFLNTNTYTDTNDNTNSEINENVNTEPEPIVLPDEINLDVPFTSQAPHSNWELPYQEACEEASAITVHYYYQSKTFTKDIADQEIKDLVAWEEENIGFYKDTTAAETAQFMKDYWGYEKVELIYDPTIKDIKTQIASGRPVIIPSAGRELGNPNFTSPGPIYHMLVVRGYTDSKFITNDVGTRNGENYQYDYDVLMNSIHDWNDGDVNNGQRVVIVAWPNE